MSHAHQRVQAAIWVLERRVELAEAAALEAERERDAALKRGRVLREAAQNVADALQNDGEVSALLVFLLQDALAQSEAQND